MTTRRLFVAGDAHRLDGLAEQLRGAGFLPVRAGFDDIVAAVVVDGVRTPGLPGLPEVPVVAVTDDADPEARLRAAVDGAVQSVPRGAGAGGVVDALGRALAPDAPSLSEQQRRARIDALEAFARRDRAPADTDRGRVHLTRLEHGPVRTSPAPPPPEWMARSDRCTPKQRELVEAIVSAGSVTNAAAALHASRSTIYAALRRIAHRVQLRDSGELLRLVGVEDHHHHHHHPQRRP